MILLGLGVVCVFLICWSISYFDANTKDKSFNGVVDASLPVYYAHLILCGIYFFSIFYRTSGIIFPYSWGSLVIIILILNSLIKCIDARYTTSMMVQLLVNTRQIYTLILLLLAFTSIWDYPLIWPSIENFGWTGDFRGILLFVIPSYNFACVSTNADLIKIPATGFAVSLVLHMFFCIVGANFGLVSQWSLWLWIILLNGISFTYVCTVHGYLNFSS